MRFSRFLILPCALAAGAVAAPVAPRTASPYPGQLNDTTPSGFEIRVASARNPQLNNRNVQLRADPADATAHLAVVDPWSPGLLYDLGPVAYLKNATTTATWSLQELYFANQTDATPPTAGFQLTDVSSDAEYNLYHLLEQTGVVNGFAACDRDGYYQLYYYTYTGPVPDFGSGCDFVAVQVRIEPTLASGAFANLGQTTVAPSTSGQT